MYSRHCSFGGFDALQPPSSNLTEEGETWLGGTLWAVWTLWLRLEKRLGFHFPDFLYNYKQKSRSRDDFYPQMSTVRTLICTMACVLNLSSGIFAIGKVEKNGWSIWQCNMDQRWQALLVVRSIEKPLKAFSLRHCSPSFALIAHGTIKWKLQNFLLSYLWANDNSLACLQLLLRVGTPCSFFQAVFVQEERPVQHARCIVV